MHPQIPLEPNDVNCWGIHGVRTRRTKKEKHATAKFGDKFKSLVAEARYGVYSVLWIELPIF